MNHLKRQGNVTGDDFNSPCSFVLVEDILFSEKYCFCYVSSWINLNKQIFLRSICRSSILKWQYFIYKLLITSVHKNLHWESKTKLKSRMKYTVQRLFESRITKQSFKNYLSLNSMVSLTTIFCYFK